MVVAFLMKSPFYKEGLNLKQGNYNGYVAFKEELPLSYQGIFDQDIDVEDNYDYLDNYISVHGGITLDHSNLWEGANIIPLTAIPEDIHSYRVIGFDCAHLNDNSEIWSFENTRSETLRLKEQIEKLINNK